jgi:hypothetical protein
MRTLVHPPEVQIAIAQKIMQSFVEKLDTTFESFIACWTEINGSQIHAGASPRALLLGPLQTGYSTFLGYFRPSARDIEKRGAIFGLYLLSSTQFAQYPAPIILSSPEMKIIAEFCREDLECASIVSSLLNRGQIAFSAAPTSIRTRFTEFPPAVVVTERIPSSSRFVTTRELEERRRPAPEEPDLQDELDEYRALMAVIRDESAAPEGEP